MRDNKNNIKNNTMLENKDEIKIWIKTLLNSYKTFPNLIKAVDNIIEIQASSMSFTSNIYNISKSTKNQIEQVIDLSERKKSLLNIYLMISKFFECLTYDKKEFAEKKFIDKFSNDELAEEYNISIRTVYRKINKIVDDIYDFFIFNNWSLQFLKLQIKGEGWLYEKFEINKNEFLNGLKSSKNYNKSSSESYEGNAG